MLYVANNKTLGSDDAYGRVLDGERRNVIRKAFHAMVRASSPLKSCPREINFSEILISWVDLRDRNIEAHKTISHDVFTGIGNKFQFEDSIIAEHVMLRFAYTNTLALPMHDSFILHSGYCEIVDVEETMRRAFHERFQSDILANEVI